MKLKKNSLEENSKAKSVSKNELVIIILNYNSAKDTISLVKDIVNFGFRYPIVIVDNCSPDGDFLALKELSERYDNVRVIRTDLNLGYASGNNFGISYAIREFDPDYFLLLNPDIRISYGLIKEMLKVIKTDPRIAVVAPKMLSEKKVISAWRLPSLKDDIILSLSFLKKLLGNPVEYDNSIYELKEPVHVDVVQGACFMIRRDAFEDVNFFDSRTFLYGEERILAFKLKEKGYKIVFLPYVEFYHSVGKSISSFYGTLQRYIMLQSSRRIYHKFYLKSSWYKLLIFDFVSFIGIWERVIISIFRKIWKRIK